MIIPGLSKYIPVLKWLGIISFFTFMISILLIPWLISILSPDYFIRGKRPPPLTHLPPTIALILTLLRNIFGIMLLLAGIAMLFLPGQGILTMLLGISLLDFPGKHRLMGKLIQQPSVQKGMNWIRAKTKQPPFIWETGA
jgi:hypothetical protein